MEKGSRYRSKLGLAARLVRRGSRLAYNGPGRQTRTAFFVWAEPADSPLEKADSNHQSPRMKTGVVRRRGTHDLRLFGRQLHVGRSGVAEPHLTLRTFS